MTLKFLVDPIGYTYKFREKFIISKWKTWYLYLPKLVDYNYLKINMDKKVEDPSTKELNTFVQNMLKQMQDRF